MKLSTGYWAFAIAGLMVVCAGCATTTSITGSATSAESLIRTYVNHVDNGRYAEALQMVADTEYGLAQQTLNSPTQMEKLRSGGGSNGEFVDITDLRISSEPASVVTYQGQTVSNQKVTWSCTLNVRGRPVKDMLTQQDTLTYTWRITINDEKVTIHSDPAIPIIPLITYATRNQ